MIDITPLILLALFALSAFIFYKLMPLIKTYTTSAQRKFVYNWVKIACEAADQMVKNGTIQKADRKNHVFDFLNSMGITYNKDEVNEMIESIVLGLPPLLLKD